MTASAVPFILTTDTDSTISVCASATARPPRRHPRRRVHEIAISGFSGGCPKKQPVFEQSAYRDSNMWFPNAPLLGERGDPLFDFTAVFLLNSRPRHYREHHGLLCLVQKQGLVHS